MPFPKFENEHVTAVQTHLLFNVMVQCISHYTMWIPATLWERVGVLTSVENRDCVFIIPICKVTISKADILV